MSFIDDAKAVATMPMPGPGTPDAQRKIYDAMPMTELAGLWSSLQYYGLRDYSEEIWNGVMYFDALPHDQPERAFELVLAVLASEAHTSVKMELNNKLMPALIGGHGERLVAEIERHARGNAQLRWLLGGSGWWASDEDVKARLKAYADESAWRADDEARDTPEHLVDVEALSIGELARFWVEQKVKPHKDQDANYTALSDLEYEWKQNDPHRLLDLILEILRIEDNPRVLSYLAAGPLEDVASMATIERIEREAAANPAFVDLLRGVWYWNESDELKRRLDAITGLNYAAA
jgi:hypothetical protein